MELRQKIRKLNNFFRKLTGRDRIVVWSMLGIYALALILFIIFIGIPLIGFASDPDKFRMWINGRDAEGRIVYIGMVILQVIGGLIPAAPFQLAGGYAFGTAGGILMYLIGSTIGSMIVFAIVRRYGIRLVKVLFPDNDPDEVELLHSSENRNLLYFIIFLIPGTPKDLLGYYAGLTDMNPLIWMVICSFGRIPSVLISSLGGDAIGSERYAEAALIILISALLSFLGIFLYKKIFHRMKDRHKS